MPMSPRTKIAWDKWRTELITQNKPRESENCIRCKHALDRIGTLCTDCVNYNKKRNDKQKRDGKCTRCGKDRGNVKGLRCADCSLFYKEKYHNNKLNGVCTICGNARDCDGSVCKKCRIKMRLQSSRVAARERGYAPCDATPDELLATFTETCQSCGKHFGEGIHMDHCHRTGKFRGWLCDKCNYIMGAADDNVEMLLSVVNYLREHK